jgi:hypothetical protein
LHAGIRKLFTAKILSIRTRFPRIVVEYTHDEFGQTNAISLPELKKAYVHAGMVEPLS